MAKIEIRIIDAAQSRRPNWLRSVALGSLFAGIFFGPGILADSAAMQWAGFVIVLAITFLVLAGFVAKTMTIEEARAHLDELEKKTS